MNDCAALRRGAWQSVGRVGNVCARLSWNGGRHPPHENKTIKSDSTPKRLNRLAGKQALSLPVCYKFRFKHES